MLTWIKRILAPPVFEGDEEKTRLARALHVTLLSLAAVGLISSTVGAFAKGHNPTLVVSVAILTVLLLIIWGIVRKGYIHPSINIVATLTIFVLSTGAVGVVGTIRAPITAIYFLGVSVAGLLLGLRGLVISTILSILALGGLWWAENSGIISPIPPTSTGMAQWLTWTTLLSTSALFFGISTQNLNEEAKRANRYAAEVEQQRRSLEDTVRERTRDLARRTRYLEATAIIARDAASELDLHELLSRVALAVSERFGFYHTGIFLLDPSGEWAELRAASSEGGQRMLARSHRLRVGKEGIVGRVIRQGRPHVAPDVRKDPFYLGNPDLPETHSEAALPLRARGEIIGALDVQSREPAAFDPDDIAILQTLADQVAIAISNARLFRQLEESRERERRVFGDLSRQAWQRLLREYTGLGFVSDGRGTSPIEDVWEPQMEEAVRSGQVAQGDGHVAPATTLSIPIKVRGQVIGVVDGRKPEGAGAWTTDEIELFQSLAEQLNIALESARLYQETQRRAAQERLLGEVTARMRETLDMDTVLQTAIREIGTALDFAEVEVRLGTSEVFREEDGEFPEGEEAAA